MAALRLCRGTPQKLLPGELQLRQPTDVREPERTGGHLKRTLDALSRPPNTGFLTARLGAAARDFAKSVEVAAGELAHEHEQDEVEAGDDGGGHEREQLAGWE